MTYSAQDREPHVNAVMNLATHCSSRDLSNKHGLQARELEVVAAAQAGSTTAFDEIQKVYSPRLFKTILRITKNREDAEDALQDTFLLAYRAFRQFEARSSVYCWLTQIAINSALMILRRRRARPETILSSFFEGGDAYSPLEIKDTALNPEQLYEQRQQSKGLLDAIRKLQPQLRAPIEIQLYNEHSIKEIADTLSISPAAVKARLYRARAHLAKRVSTHYRTRNICE